jgi:hypothetical protein
MEENRHACDRRNLADSIRIRKLDGSLSSLEEKAPLARLATLATLSPRERAPI